LQIARRARIEFDSDSDGLFATQSLGGGPALGSSTYKALSTIADWYFFVMLGLGAIGLLLLFRSPRVPERRIVFVAFASLFVIPLLLWGNQRFHVPLLPFLALFAAAALQRVATRVGARRSTAT
jgi:hypothetical protein